MKSIKLITTLFTVSAITLPTMVNATQCSESRWHVACLTEQGTIETQSKYPYDFIFLGHPYGESLEPHPLEIPQGIEAIKVSAGPSATAFLGDDTRIYAYGGHFNSPDRYGAWILPGHHYTDIEVCGGYIFSRAPEQMTVGEPRIHMWDITRHINHNPLQTTKHIQVDNMACIDDQFLYITDTDGLTYEYDVNQRSIVNTESTIPPSIEFYDEYTVRGEFFGSQQGMLTIDGIELEVESWSTSSITFTAPASTISGALVINTYEGLDSVPFEATIIGSGKAGCEPDIVEIITEVEVIKEVIVETVVKVPRELDFEELLELVIAKATESKKNRKALRKAIRKSSKGKH